MEYPFPLDSFRLHEGCMWSDKVREDEEESVVNVGIKKLN